MAVDEAVVTCTSPNVRKTCARLQARRAGGYDCSRMVGCGTPGKAFGEVAGVAVDNSSGPSDPAAGDCVLESVASAKRRSGIASMCSSRRQPVGAEEASEGTLCGLSKAGREARRTERDTRGCRHGQGARGRQREGRDLRYSARGRRRQADGHGLAVRAFPRQRRRRRQRQGDGGRRSDGDIMSPRRNGSRLPVRRRRGMVGWITTAAAGAPFAEPAAWRSRRRRAVRRGRRRGDRRLFGPGVVVPERGDGQGSRSRQNGHDCHAGDGRR